MRLAAPDRRQQLIDTAMRLFSEKGFYGTTTQQIARAANVNEAIIFRHFATKEELYWAVVSNRVEAAERHRRLREHLDPEAEPREVLITVAESLLDRSEEDTALTRLLFFSALRSPELSDSFFRTYMSETFELVSTYFRKGMQLGRFRKLDPATAARGFFGMIVYQYLVQELFAGARYKKADSHDLAQQLVDIWLKGVSLDEKPNGKNSINGNRGKPALVAAGSGLGKSRSPIRR